MDTEAVELHGNTYSGQMSIYSNLKYSSHVTKHINVKMGVISLQDLFSKSFKESVYNIKASPFQYQHLLGCSNSQLSGRPECGKRQKHDLTMLKLTVFEKSLMIKPFTVRLLAHSYSALQCNVTLKKGFVVFCVVESSFSLQHRREISWECVTLR